MTRGYAEEPGSGRGARRRRGRWPLAVGGAIVTVFFLTAVFADFLAPYDYRAQSRGEPQAPPAALRFRDAQGTWRLRPVVSPRRLVDPLSRSYVEEAGRAYPLELFARGYSYRLCGIWVTDRHLFGVRGEAEAPRVYLLGTDGLGRDRLSRLIIGSRFSLLVGPLATALASLIGILLGCFAGYGGRWADAALMRAADVVMALPTLVFILAARAAFPPELPPARAAALLVTILVALGWAEMARLTRGLVLELREREFVQAAVSLGASPARILLGHILPNAARQLTAQALLILPAFLLAETALSFLGVGVQEPEASWGSLLAAAADTTLLARGHALALLAPALAIALFVLGVRLLGGGVKQEAESENC